MRIVLHIGATKTGSSALQIMLDGARERLAEAGVHYSPHGIVRGAHHLLAASVHPSAWHMHATALPADRSAHFRALSQQMLGEAEAQGATTLLISSEYFWGSFDLTVYRSIAAAFTPHPMTVLAFLRDPVEWAASTYLQAVKGGESRDFSTYFEAVLAPWQSGLYPFRVINRYNTLLPAAHVTTIDYAGAKTDVFGALMEALGVAVASPAVSERVNPSPGLSDMEALLAVNRSDAPQEEKAATRRTLLGRLTPGARTDAFLSPAQTQRILTLTEPSSRLLGAHFAAPHARAADPAGTHPPTGAPSSGQP